MSCRVLIAAVQPILRIGLKRLLEQNAFQVTAAAAGGEEAVSLASSTRPDVVILDATRPELDAFQVAHRIHEVSRQTRMLLLTDDGDTPDLVDELKDGIWGYVMRTEEPGILFEAIADAKAGNAYRRPVIPGQAHLSPRETEILVRIAQGATTKSIAAELGLSAKTIEAHRIKAMAKLKIRDTASLVRYAIHTRLVKP